MAIRSVVSVDSGVMAVWSSRSCVSELEHRLAELLTRLRKTETDRDSAREREATALQKVSRCTPLGPLPRMIPESTGI